MIVTGHVEAVVACRWRNKPGLDLSAVAARYVVFGDLKLGDKLLRFILSIEAALAADIRDRAAADVLPTDAVSANYRFTNSRNTILPGLNFTVDGVCVPLTDDAVDAIDSDRDVTLREAVTVQGQVLATGVITLVCNHVLDDGY